MTANEAIKIIEVAKAECEWNAPLDYQEAFDLAISALREQLTCNKLQQVATDTISRQAVIDLYKQYQPYMAVKVVEFGKALEQLPSAQPELCDDAVSRQNVIETIKDMHGRCDTGNIDDYCDLMVESLSVLTPVTPKRKTGKWTLLEECANAGYYCSECRKKVVKEGWSGTVKKIKFCPNCGAKMNGGDGIKEGSKDV